jgi:hypothetical protein
MPKEQAGLFFICGVATRKLEQLRLYRSYSGLLRKGACLSQYFLMERLLPGSFKNTILHLRH